MSLIERLYTLYITDIRTCICGILSYNSFSNLQGAMTYQFEHSNQRELDYYIVFGKSNNDRHMVH